MIIKRLATLQMILLGGFSSVFLLPKEIKVEPAAVSLSLPEFVGDWKGVDKQITEGERQSLGPDTQFARKLYERGEDQIFVSVVLSGPDMNTSIHRPERCLPAQGFTISESKPVAIRLPKGEFKATRLHTLQAIPTRNGVPVTINGLNYYWFVGHNDVTESHLQRTWIDIRDRVLRGRNQQWAYITVAAPVTKDFRVFGRDEKQTDVIIQQFIAELLPQLQGESVASR